MEELNIYETIIILGEKTTVKELDAVKKEIEKRISRKFDLEEIGLRELAYAIRKNKYGYYLMYQWRGTIENTTVLHNYMRISETIIKFITIKRDPEDEDIKI